MRTQLHIGEIAGLLGVTPKTIRHYHKIGLLNEPERTEAGYRLYDAQALLRLQRIRRLQSLGLSLKQIKAVLGNPTQEQSLRQILQSLDEELRAQIAILEERRQKIRSLLDSDTFETVDTLPVESPTFDYVQGQMAAYHTTINPALWEQEAQLYALLDNLHWSEGQPIAMKEQADSFIQHFTEHPEEYQQLLALGERLMTLASLPEDAAELQHLTEDFDSYFERYPFMLELQKQVSSVEQESPFSHILAELLAPMLTPGQRSVLNKIGNRQEKEGKT